jgi:hypothetical protein
MGANVHVLMRVFRLCSRRRGGRRVAVSAWWSARWRSARGGQRDGGQRVAVSAWWSARGVGARWSALGGRCKDEARAWFSEGDFVRTL